MQAAPAREASISPMPRRGFVPLGLCLAVLMGLAGAAAAQSVPDDHEHPAGDYRHAATLFEAGRRDEAVCWFYRGQLRARIHLLARHDLPPDRDPAVFASLNEVVGRPINEYAFGDIAALLAVIDQVLAWHAANDDRFTPKARFAAAHEQVTAGLVRLRAQTLAQQASIVAQRRANGLPNRTPAHAPNCSAAWAAAAR
jgi:hypothetical protein